MFLLASHAEAHTRDGLPALLWNRIAAVGAMAQAGTRCQVAAGSLNGVFVKLHDEEELLDGDVFRIGQELLRYDEIPGPVPLDDGTDVMGSPNPGYWGRLALIFP